MSEPAREVEAGQASRIDDHVQDRGLCGFVAPDAEPELERDLLHEYLRDLDDQFGPVPQDVLEEFDALWPC